MKRVKKFISNKISLTVIGLIFFFLIWEIISLSSKNATMIFPDPFMTIKQAFIYLGEGYTYKCIWGTLKRTLIGFTFSFVLALISGVIVGNFTNVKHVFNPTIIALKTIPTAALVFVFLVIGGAKNTPIYIVSLISFPILYESVVGGYSNIDNDIKNVLKVDGGRFFHDNIKVKLPLAFPYIAVGIASSFALSFKISIMAEVIAGSTSPGLGSVIKANQNTNPSNMVPIFAYSFIAIIIALLTSLIVYLVKKKFPDLTSK